MKRRLLVLSIICALVLGFTAAPLFAQEEEAEKGPLKVDDVISEDLKAKGLDGKEVILVKSLESDFTIFQFMTTACNACQTELVELLKLQKGFGVEKLQVVPISMDMMGADAVNAYESRYKYGLKYLVDSDFALPPMFGFAYTPSIFMVDKSGKVVYMKGGFLERHWKKEVKIIKGLVQ